MSTKYLIINILSLPDFFSGSILEGLQFFLHITSKSLFQTQITSCYLSSMTPQNKKDVNIPRTLHMFVLETY